MTEEEFRRLCEFLYRRTGMVFTEAKRYYVERRLVERMSIVGSGSFGSYFARLRTDVDREIERLINAVTVNETYFYREDHQLRCLTNDLLDDRLKHKAKGETIRIWSVPCSTGEEPFSIAIWLLENWRLVDQYDIEIVGSDIDTMVMEKAHAGFFGKRALMRLTDDLVRRYFEPQGREVWRIIDELRQSVLFTPVNIVNLEETRQHGRFDIIFCRNVLIYFDDASRRVAAENLYENLMPGGFICLGHTESMSRITSLFSVQHFTDAIVYQKPREGPHER
ncbi:protein-glutamate O-methyltransferase CheR [Paraburkholderia sp. DHOC27]|nr:protein-glutamate O-methyltransferase CheR [Paraburkholderia sp. DHOC27]